MKHIKNASAPLHEAPAVMIGKPSREHIQYSIAEDGMSRGGVVIGK